MSRAPVSAFREQRVHPSLGNWTRCRGFCPS